MRMKSFCCIGKRKKIKSRRQKKRVDVSGPWLEREEGDVGSPRVEREEENISLNEEFMEELRREMRRRAHVQPTEAEVAEESNDASFDSGSEGSFLTSSSGSEAEHVVRIKHTRPRFKQGEPIPQFVVCMVFLNKSVFMKVVISHAIHFRRDVRFIQNEKKMCRVICKQSECEWRILCSIDGRSGQWMVKTYFGQHTCQKQHHISCLNYKILADWFIHRLRRLTLKLTLVEMRDHFKDQTKISVSKGLCRHAKMKVIEHYIGDPLKEFARLEDYVAELNRSNSGSTVVLEGPDGVFKRMYVCFDGGSEGSFLTSSSGSEAEHAVRIKHTRPQFKQGEPIPQFVICMVFPNKSVFMKVVISHAIHFRRDVRFIQNEKKMCRVICKQSECEWRILCSIDGRSGQWMVKTYFGQHTCQKQHHISCLNYKILADWFIHRLRRLTLKLTLVEMRDHFKDQTKISVSKGLCRHAKMKVIEHYIGDPLKEFARLEDYVAELNRSNSGSTVVLEGPDGVFKRMYVCFDGVRKGFNTACRKIIGLDDCFLKGPYKGEILTAKGRDANDQIYPIAWAIVGYEDKETWKWFLDLLMVDLDIVGGNYVYASDGAPNIVRGGRFTFMSDQQKGLILAIAELMPSAVHRRCARHIFAKWRKQHYSDDLHLQFWAICKASTPAEFLDELEIL